MDATPGDPRIADTLANLSAHLDMLAGQVFDVEEALSALLPEEGSSSGVSITRLQSLDFARQSLEDCALMLAALSKQPAAEAFLEDPTGLDRKLKLDTTRQLISNSAIKKNSDCSGDVDFF